MNFCGIPAVTRRSRRSRGTRPRLAIRLLTALSLLSAVASPPAAHAQQRSATSRGNEQASSTATAEDVGPALEQDSLVFVGPPVPPGLAERLPPPRPVMEEVGEGVFTVSGLDGLFVITDAGRNAVARVTPAGLVLVLDPSGADSAAMETHEAIERITDRLRQVSDQPMAYTVATHTHDDGGSIAHGALILHKNASARARETHSEATKSPPPGGPTPRLVFATRATLFAGAVEIRLHHLGPGHTDGDIVAEFPDLGVVYTGDLVVDETPFVDYARGGTSTGWVAALGQMLALDFTTAIPGRGPAMTRFDIQVFRNKLVTLRARMVQLIREGATSDDVTSGLAPLVTDDLDWPLDPDGLFMTTDGLGGLYDEVSVLPERPAPTRGDEPSDPR